MAGTVGRPHGLDGSFYVGRRRPGAAGRRRRPFTSRGARAPDRSPRRLRRAADRPAGRLRGPRRGGGAARGRAPGRPRARARARRGRVVGATISRAARSTTATREVGVVTRLLGAAVVRGARGAAHGRRAPALLVPLIRDAVRDGRHRARGRSTSTCASWARRDADRRLHAVPGGVRRGSPPSGTSSTRWRAAPSSRSSTTATTRR